MNDIIESKVGSIIKFRNRFLTIESFIENRNSWFVRAIDQSGQPVELQLSQAEMVISRTKYDFFLRANEKWQGAVVLEEGIMRIDPDKVPESQYGFARSYNGTVVLEDINFGKATRP